ncbi:hypothetical protein AA313_de0202947 [Arthrobotrys entomopaga]|nr:hypothetical protein AA313_de0202947 [Arthrobotrys entomopaga]
MLLEIYIYIYISFWCVCTCVDRVLCNGSLEFQCRERRAARPGGPALFDFQRREAASMVVPMPSVVVSGTMIKVLFPLAAGKASVFYEYVADICPDYPREQEVFATICVGNLGAVDAKGDAEDGEHHVDVEFQVEPADTGKLLAEGALGGDGLRWL